MTAFFLDFVLLFYYDRSWRHSLYSFSYSDPSSNPPCWNRGHQQCDLPLPWGYHHLGLPTLFGPTNLISHYPVVLSGLTGHASAWSNWCWGITRVCKCWHQSCASRASIFKFWPSFLSERHSSRCRRHRKISQTQWTLCCASLLRALWHPPRVSACHHSYHSAYSTSWPLLPFHCAPRSPSGPWMRKGTQ